MAGFFTNGVCFPTIQQATDTHFSSLNVFTTNPPASPAFIFKYIRNDDGSWVISKTDLFGNPATSLPIQPMFFASCETHTDTETQFLNGMELGWGVASIVVIAFVLRRLRRGF